MIREREYGALTDRFPWPRTTVLLVNVAATSVVIAAIRAASDVLVPLLLAIFLAAIVAPSIDALARFGVSRWLAVGLVTLLFTGACLLGLAYLGVSLNELFWRLPEIQGQLAGFRAQVLQWLDHHGIPIPEGPSTEAVFDPARGVRMLTGLLSGLSSILSDGLLILATVAFALLESAGLPAKMRAIFGIEGEGVNRALKILKDLRRYMLIKSWISLSTGISVGVGLALLGVRYAPLWGILAFLLNFVPTIGSLIAALPPLILALVQNGWPTALGVALLFLAINFVFGYLVEPPAMGRRLGLSTLVVWLSLIFWGWVLGPVGMFLSVPLTITCKIILDAAPETRWLAILLGPSVPPQEATAPPSGGAGTSA